MAELWKGKRWYTITSPKMFGAKQIAEAPVGDPKQVIGRTLTTFLSDLTGDPSKYFYKVKLKINNFEGNNAETEFISHECSRDFVSRMIRRRVRRIDNRVITTTNDAKIIVKSLATAMKKADTTVEKAIRRKIADEIVKIANGTSLEDFMKGVFSGEIQKIIKKEASKVYPVREFEITKVEKRISKMSQ